MGIFDEIKKVGSAAGSAVSEGAAKVGKLSQVEIEKRKLKSLQDEVASAQQEMGALVYDLMERGELSHPGLGAAQSMISEAQAQVSAKEAEIEAMKAEARDSEEPFAEAEVEAEPSENESGQV